MGSIHTTSSCIAICYDLKPYPDPGRREIKSSFCRPIHGEGFTDEREDLIKRTWPVLCLIILLAVFVGVSALSRPLKNYYQRYQDSQRDEETFQLYGRGLAFSRAGRLTQAMEDWKSALERDPGYTPARYALARLYGGQGKTAEAEAEYRAILVQSARENDKTHSAWAHYELGEILAKQGKTAEARAEWQAVLDSTPTNVPQQGGIYAVRTKAQKALSGR